MSAVGFILTADDETVLIRNLALLLPMLAIAIVDSLIRKIPNSLLLVMIITQAAYIAYVCITSHTIYALINAGIGFFLGFFAFTIPSFLKVPVGAGDVKYSAVIGLIMYIGCYLQVMMIVGIFGFGSLHYIESYQAWRNENPYPHGSFHFRFNSNFNVFPGA